jgi:hypothetical protein
MTESWAEKCQIFSRIEEIEYENSSHKESHVGRSCRRGDIVSFDDVGSDFAKFKAPGEG